MANLARKPLKIFAEDATNTGVFGSCADGTKVYSTDPATIQSKPAWPLGWDEATIGSRKFPPLEEMQGIQFLVTYHLSYLLQKGIPEYDPATTYYEHDIVRQPGAYALYGSLTNGNTGNDLDDTLNWGFLQDLSQTAQHATTSVFGTVRLAAEADIAVGSSSGNVPTAAQVSAHGFVTGDIKSTTLSTLQSGWIWAQGTIGNASSGASNRSNADCYDLFKAYWNDPAYTYSGATASGAALQVYTSSGAAVAKGVSADADWNANRRIAVFDAGDRVLAGRGNMVGNAGRLSGQTGGVSGNGLGNTGGFETHSLSEAQNGTHLHAIPLQLRRGSQGFVPPGGFDGGDIYLGETSNNTAQSGQGAPHNNVQPTIICNYIIKL